MYCTGTLTGNIIYFIYIGYMSTKEGCSFWEPMTDVFLRRGSFRKILLPAFTLDLVVSFVGGFLYILTLEYAILAGINQGVLTTLFGLRSIFLAFIGVLLFKETMNSCHYLGIAAMLACSVIISLSSHTEDQQKVIVYGEEAEGKSAYAAVLMAIATPVFFALNGTSTRVFKLKFDIDPLFQKNFTGLVLNLFMLVACFIWARGFSVEIYIRTFFSGIMAAVG